LIDARGRPSWRPLPVRAPAGGDATPEGQKRPRDTNQLGKLMVDILTGDHAGCFRRLECAVHCCMGSTVTLVQEEGKVAVLSRVN
jgi:hypothetical protein